MSPFGYNICVGYEVVKSDGFLRWLARLRDKRAQAQILVRIDRVEEGNLGDHRSVGGGVSELRVNVGQGYRIYYTIRPTEIVYPALRWRQDEPAARHKTRPADGK